MSTLAVEIEIPFAEKVTISVDTLCVDLSDGRTISVPLSWYPRLMHATLAERKRWRLIGRAAGNAPHPASAGRLTGTKPMDHQRPWKPP